MRFVVISSTLPVKARRGSSLFDFRKESVFDWAQATPDAERQSDKINRARLLIDVKSC